MRPELNKSHVSISMARGNHFYTLLLMWFVIIICSIVVDQRWASIEDTWPIARVRMHPTWLDEIEAFAY